MAIYTGVADSNGDFTIPFSQNYTSGQKVTVKASKDGAEKSIELYAPAGVVGGGSIRFSGNYANFPQNIGVVTLSEEINNIGDYAFRASIDSNNIWKRATGLTISGNMLSFGRYAFADWSAMLSLQLPVGLTSIPEGAFNNCNALESVTLPTTITSIGSSAFAYCQKVKTVTIPDMVTLISSYAFRFINSATQITIGSSVNNIGTDAFINASSCNELLLKPATPPTITNTTFSGLKSTCVIKVPSASLSAYQTATNWSALSSRMVGY